MCKEKEKCENKECKCLKEDKETFVKTKSTNIGSSDSEKIKPKNYGKETFGI